VRDDVTLSADYLASWYTLSMKRSAIMQIQHVVCSKIKTLTNIAKDESAHGQTLHNMMGALSGGRLTHYMHMIAYYGLPDHH